MLRHFGTTNTVPKCPRHFGTGAEMSWVRSVRTPIIIPLSVKVVRALNHDLILGTDFLVENQVVIDYSTGVVSIQQDLLRVPLQSWSQRQHCVVTTQATCIPPFTEAIVAVSCPKFYNNKSVFLEPISSFQFR